MHVHEALDPIRSLQVAWKLLKQTPVTVLIGGLLLAFLEGGGGGAPMNLRQHDISGAGSPGEVLRQVFEQMKPWLMVMIPIALCIGLAFFALSSWIEVGFGRALESGLRTGKDEVGKVFSGGDRFGAMLLARLLCGLILFASALPLVGGAIAVAFLGNGQEFQPLMLLVLLVFALLWFVLVVYLSLGLYLVNPIVALETCSPTEAIARSWNLSSGNRLRLLWFMILQFLLAIVSICCTCCLGLFITVPLTQVMRFECYIALSKGEQYPQWWIGTGRFPFDEHKAEDYSSPPAPPPVPPPLPPQS
jgi:hypothetical protein